MTDFTAATNKAMRERAEKCNGEYYTVSYTTVENPLTIQQVAKITTDLYQGFASFAKRHPDKSCDALRSAYVATVTDPHVLRYINKTHPTIAKSIMDHL